MSKKQEILPNIHPETGIRYGVIPLNSLPGFVWDYLIPYYAPSNEDDMFIDPIGYYYAEGGYRLFTDSDCIDLFIEESPYTAQCALCSPCAPNAGYLKDPGNFTAYALGPEWFDEENPCPYTPVKI